MLYIFLRIILLQAQGIDDVAVMARIEGMIAKTLISAEGQIASHNVRQQMPFFIALALSDSFLPPILSSSPHWCCCLLASAAAGRGRHLF